MNQPSLEISRFLDLALPVCVQLGERKVTVAELLALAPGALLVFPEAAGEDSEIQVGRCRLGRGELVVLDNRMCLRLTGLHTEEVEDDN